MFWSVSSHNCWQRCQRQYYFDQIMGLAQANDSLRKRAYELGNIQEPRTWVGSVIHAVMETGLVPELEHGRWPQEKSLIEQAVDLARRQFAFSEQRAFLGTKKSEAGDRYLILSPHYFNTSVPTGTLDRSIDTITQCLRGLARSPGCQAHLLGRKRYWAEQPFIFKVQPMTVRAVADLVMVGKDDCSLEIVDWKVTQGYNRAHLQLAVYALAAQQAPAFAQYAREGITRHIVNLLEPDPGVAFGQPLSADTEILVEARDFIYESIESIQAVVQGRKYDQLDVEDFEYARNPNSCAICNWRTLCVELSDGPASGKPVSNHQPEATQLELPFV